MLRQKMGNMAVSGSSGYGDVPVPTTNAAKFGGNITQESARNPFGVSQEDDPHYWYALFC